MTKNRMLCFNRSPTSVRWRRRDYVITPPYSRIADTTVGETRLTDVNALDLAPARRV